VNWSVSEARVPSQGQIALPNFCLVFPLRERRYWILEHVSCFTSLNSKIVYQIATFYNWGFGRWLPLLHLTATLARRRRIVWTRRGRRIRRLLLVSFCHLVQTFDICLLLSPLRRGVKRAVLLIVCFWICRQRKRNLTMTCAEKRKASFVWIPPRIFCIFEWVKSSAWDKEVNEVFHCSVLSCGMPVRSESERRRFPKYDGGGEIYCADKIPKRVFPAFIRQLKLEKLDLLRDMRVSCLAINANGGSLCCQVYLVTAPHIWNANMMPYHTRNCTFLSKFNCWLIHF
jgi:hypothetical protein